MRVRSLTLLIIAASLALVLAACDTAADDDVAEAADDTVSETTDDTSDDAAVEEETDDEAGTDDAEVEAEATDDEEAEATDDEGADDLATDDSTAEATDDAAEVVDDADEEFALADEEFEAVLLALGFDSAEEAEAPALDTETLTAETPAMTLQAAAYENTYVGEITEQLLIAVSLDSTYADQANAISAYVCDGDEVGFYVTGEIENGQATIQLAENAVLEFTVNGETISGAVTMNEQELGSFDASEATGDAGLYLASETVEGTDVAARWIVLEDGRQAGQICIGIWARGVCIGVYVSRN